MVFVGGEPIEQRVVLERMFLQHVMEHPGIQQHVSKPHGVGRIDRRAFIDERLDRVTAEEAVHVGTRRKPVAPVTNVDERPETLPERGGVGIVERRPKFGRIRHGHDTSCGGCTAGRIRFMTDLTTNGNTPSNTNAASNCGDRMPLTPCSLSVWRSGTVAPA